jgi:hypothetical protein
MREYPALFADLSVFLKTLMGGGIARIVFIRSFLYTRIKIIHWLSPHKNMFTQKLIIVKRVL